VLTGGWTSGDGKELVEETMIEYVVDAESFAPIAATSTTRVDFEGDITSATRGGGSGSRFRDCPR
jgi:hypothetical protein